MTSTKPKSQEKDEVVVEEEIGVFERTIEQVVSSSPTKQKCKREDEFPVMSPSKYRQTSDGNRSATTTTVKQDSLSVPFWKTLNRRRQSSFQADEIGYFSLHSGADEKECFDDKRYLRGICF